MKYEILKESKVVEGHTLYKIKFIDSKGRGKIGGWIEKKENLDIDEDDNSWIDSDSMIYGDAVVKGRVAFSNTKVLGNTKILVKGEKKRLYVRNYTILDSEIKSGGRFIGRSDIRHSIKSSIIEGTKDSFLVLRNTSIYMSRVSGKCHINETTINNSRVSGYSIVSGSTITEAVITFRSFVSESTIENASLYDRAQVIRSTIKGGGSILWGHAKVYEKKLVLLGITIDSVYPEPSKKYALLKDHPKEYNGKTLYLIQALKEFIVAGVKINAGSTGGWIEKEENLGDGAWVSEGSIVYEDAIVSGDVLVSGESLISGASKVIGESIKIRGHSEISENARVEGTDIVISGCSIRGCAEVLDSGTRLKNTHLSYSIFE